MGKSAVIVYQKVVLIYTETPLFRPLLQTWLFPLWVYVSLKYLGIFGHPIGHPIIKSVILWVLWNSLAY